MAIIKCKMCGGDLILVEGQSVAECEHCGRKQTIPLLDDEKKLIQFERAERLRKQCEFDKAAGIYESIVADFRQEAEAYWGLVLCKYGIEYVDDPATGKKIPTCHRSSFDSILDDSNFDQALENADAVALRLYREEAKQIEEIRRGILAVSSNEQPYDIFICYKETDAHGDRTVDSLLAQDIYDALISKGYRVFFSRITLEDKLGQAYEPYIFAALNSARIMLAVGTCYEHYNAVWVKNEWGRYLKIIAQDKSKYLIPCYKGIDAYDIPREFSHLQGQDMGKVGAIQDLLRGIEKILPKQQNHTTVIQETVVVGGGGDNKIASLLDRGNMALEDGDWAKADSFFEDVLNNDAKNAQAYLGKALAQEKCRTMDAFVRKRKELHQYAAPQTLQLDPKTAHIEDMVQQYAISGYLPPETIRQQYPFDRSYASQVASRRQQYSAEQSYWVNHKLLSRAEQFATGAVAENLAAEKKALFTALSERVKAAEAAEVAAKAQVQQAYDAHIAKVDQRTIQMHQEGLQRQNAYYQSLVQVAKNSTVVQQLKNTAVALDQLGDYQDSKNMAAHCRKRAADLQTIIDAERARIEEARRREAKAQQARTRKILIIVFAAIVVILVAILLITRVFIPNSKYKNAVALMEAGSYEEAIVAFEALDGYKDSATLIKECQYRNALALMSAEQYEEAIAAFEAMNGYKDSAEKITECKTIILDGKYEDAVALMEAGKYVEAIAAFEALDGYKDSATLVKECQYRNAMALMNAGMYEKAIEVLESLIGYKDSQEQIVIAENSILQEAYDEAMAFYNKGDYSTAKKKFAAIQDFKDAAQWVQKCDDQMLEAKYQKGIGYYNTGSYTLAITIFEGLGDYKDCKTQIFKCETAIVSQMTGYLNDGEYAVFVSYSKDLPLKYFERIDFTTEQLRGVYAEITKSITSSSMYRSMYQLSDLIASNQKMLEAISDYPDAANLLAMRDILDQLDNYDDSCVLLFKDYLPQISTFWETELLRKAFTSDYSIAYYLHGEWADSSGNTLTFFHKDGTNLNTTWCSYDLPYPDVEHAYWDIRNLEFVFLDEDSNVVARVYKFEFLDANTLQVYCYKDSKTYTLTRSFYTEGLVFSSMYNGYNKPNTYQISDYTGSDTEVFIPEIYKGVTVTAIADSAFYYNSTLKKIELPSTITTIGKNAFSGCSALTSIELPSGLLTIGQGAFSSCSSLKTVYIGKNVTTIQSGAFSGCSKLTTIVFDGTMAQWKAITKEQNWDFNTGNYVIQCSDGNINK